MIIVYFTLGDVTAERNCDLLLVVMTMRSVAVGFRFKIDFVILLNNHKIEIDIFYEKVSIFNTTYFASFSKMMTDDCVIFRTINLNLSLSLEHAQKFILNGFGVSFLVTYFIILIETYCFE